MAIIKCPECGHQISDKAPVCPSCGVEIAGMIEKCPYCGEVFLKNDGVCPHCHKSVGTKLVMTNEIKHTSDSDISNNNSDTSKDTSNGSPLRKDKKKNKSILWVSIIIAIIILGVCAYVYNSAQNNREQEEYEFAMSSNDPMVLQTYLDNFKNAPSEHIDSISEHLRILRTEDQEWINAVVSNSKSALSEYIKNHPESQHRTEALNKIDSIDWAQCSKTNTADAYQLYIDNHAEGNHIDEAQLALKDLISTLVSPEERQVIIKLFRQFFMSINEKDEDNLISTVGDIVNFLGKASASKSDIVTFMHKLYKPEVENLVWSMSKDLKIDKTEITDGVYEYSVTFMANEKVTKTDNSTSTTPFRISAIVDSDGKISDFSMTKIVE